jgi:hypothetical protein
MPGGPGQFAPQQWPAPVPPKKGGAGKWILGVVALVAVVAVTAVVAVSCTKNTGGNAAGGGSVAGNNSGIASANDTGPVGIITEDPSCAPWGPVSATLANIAKNGWNDRDRSMPATAWSPEQQSQYQAAAQAYRSAADQTVPLVKLTPHRVMRELYEQFIAYSRALADKIPTYTANDGPLSNTAATITLVVNGVCGAITYGVAAARGPLVSAASPPTHIAPLGDPSNPSRFMPTVDAQCSDWASAIKRINSDPAYAVWSNADPNVPASSWSDQDKAENQAVMPVLNSFADQYEKLGRQSSNPVVEDLGVLAAQYGRAFVAGIPTYTQSDIQLFAPMGRVPGLIDAACDAAGAN